MKKILLTLAGEMIAPRFDLATDIRIVRVEDNMIVTPPKTMLLPGPSADDLSGLVLKENINSIICNGIEEEHYSFLTWKKIEVIDRVIGSADAAIRAYLDGELKEGMILHED